MKGGAVAHNEDVYSMTMYYVQQKAAMSDV